MVRRNDLRPNRREFLRNTAAAASALALAGEKVSVVGEPEGWFDRPMRWAQLTLVEDNPGKYDPGFWLDYFKRTHSDAACLSAGGCLAYYPTKIPLHHRSRWLGERDAFGAHTDSIRRRHTYCQRHKTDRTIRTGLICCARQVGERGYVGFDGFVLQTRPHSEAAPSLLEQQAPAE